MVAQGLRLTLDHAVGVIDLGDEGRWALAARGGDLQGVAIGVCGDLFAAQLLQHGRLGQQGDEVIGLHRQGVVQHRQRAPEIANQPKGERAVQQAVVGAAKGVSLIQQLQRALRVAPRDGFRRALEQRLLLVRLIHVASPEANMNSL